MGWPALAIAGSTSAAASGEDVTTPLASADGEPVGQEPWVFEDIFLTPRTLDATPSRVVVRIEAELLGFVVEERSTWRPRRTWRTRKSYATTGADAVIEAGRITHSWLSRGYSICRA